MRCAVDLAPLRAEPRDDAEQVTQALRGEPLAVVESRDGWARVVTAYAYPGWVRSEHVEEGEEGWKALSPDRLEKMISKRGTAMRGRDRSDR